MNIRNPYSDGSWHNRKQNTVKVTGISILSEEPEAPDYSTVMV